MIDSLTRSEMFRSQYAGPDGTIRWLASIGHTDSEIGDRIGRDRQWVGRRRREMGIPAGQPPSLRMMIARLNFRLTSA